MVLREVGVQRHALLACQRPPVHRVNEVAGAQQEACKEARVKVVLVRGALRLQGKWGLRQLADWREGDRAVPVYLGPPPPLAWLAVFSWNASLRRRRSRGRGRKPCTLGRRVRRCRWCYGLRGCASAKRAAGRGQLRAGAGLLAQACCWLACGRCTGVGLAGCDVCEDLRRLHLQRLLLALPRQLALLARRGLGGPCTRFGLRHATAGRARRREERVVRCGPAQRLPLALLLTLLLQALLLLPLLNRLIQALHVISLLLLPRLLLIGSLLFPAPPLLLLALLACT
mmetsp:Transcript_58067/g.186568  ORF Transcript_58067/g.186568 Transcript_58067/m.186568 type:complete len:285 (+) Transcript_58067:627-1481(+)